MLIGKGAGCFKCHFRFFIKISKFYFHGPWAPYAHITGVSPRFFCNYLEFGLAFLGEIRSYMDLFIGIVIGIFGAKNAPLRGSKYSKKGEFSHIAFFLRSWKAHDDVIAHLHIVQESLEKRKFV